MARFSKMQVLDAMISTGMVPVYYNKDIFNELGVEVPTTIDELENIMAKAKEAGYIPTECGGDAYHQILWAVESMVLNGAPKEEGR